MLLGGHPQPSTTLRCTLKVTFSEIFLFILELKSFISGQAEGSHRAQETTLTGWCGLSLNQLTPSQLSAVRRSSWQLTEQHERMVETFSGETEQFVRLGRTSYNTWARVKNISSSQESGLNDPAFYSLVNSSQLFGWEACTKLFLSSSGLVAGLLSELD